ncbi:hypothetical protein DFH07DRAFT_816070 [Mycena maculata]|uniref:CST complex subunit STN1 n=1 Tax=Mycena maculata TaxID=230809 RepID=A0AAD7JD93_9AGAR|nr:hypothetical protein DFH07DRAFT_816070 [Mycena maculata]
MASTSQSYAESGKLASSRGKQPLHRILQWTLTPEAVASCFARDVFNMRESGIKDAGYFWLGRVPCRSVKLIGLLVGVQTYEARIVYYLDDGSAVIECHHRPGPTAPAPNKVKQEKTVKEVKTEPPLPLKPVAFVGDSVSIIGRISPLRDTRKIVVDSIARCPSANDEPRHWIAVRALHKTHYSLDEPFEIPARPASQLPSNTNNTRVLPPVTPSSFSTGSSPFSSPVKSTPSSHASPHRLRHPSRLHTQELTDNAFRIYLKHYMDNADDLRPPLPEPSTPTKPSRHALALGHETPRPHDHTPRRVVPLDFVRPFISAQDSESVRGFTVSYLRRVPELSLMAKRVVKAEAKRRAREARKKAKELGLSQKAVVVTKVMRNDQEKLHPRMKRLFHWAILQLVKDGDVISWDGPVRPYVENGDEHPDPNASGLWKINSSNSTVGGNSTVFSSASIAEDDEDEGVLTDPEPGEEAFVSLTPAFMVPYLENAISKWTAEATARAKDGPNSARSRVRALASGPTVGEITSFLKNDDMWRHLSDFTVQEGLAHLQDEGRAWMVGEDRWELSI